jgi:hypothetical protein
LDIYKKLKTQKANMKILSGLHRKKNPLGITIQALSYEKQRHAIYLLP